MKKLIVSLMVAGLAIPQSVFAQADAKSFHVAQKQKRVEYREQQHQENKDFRQTLKGKTPQETAAAIRDHHEQQHGENAAFRDQMRQERLDFWKQKIENNKKLSEAQKTELLNLAQSQQEQNKTFRDQQHSENQAFWNDLASKKDMTFEEMRAAIKQHHTTQKSENKAHRQEQKEARKDLRESFKAGTSTTETAPAAHPAAQ